jgi:carbon-monoxide dehydrogenase large subunit
MAQIVADVLGVRPEDVEVSVGDTGKMEWGVGTFASRSAAVAAPAVFKAASKVKEKMLRLAAKLLEVSPQDLEVGGGRVYIRDDPSTGFTLAELAAKSAPLRGTIEEEPGLEATDFFSPQRSVYSSGGCVVMCSVDTETGYVKIEKIWLVHDCGNMINPMIVEGQIHGGLSMGVGSTLYEEIVHDEDGNPMTANFADYLLPSAVEMPAEIELAHLTTPTSMNPLGVKGVGEAGVIPIAAAVASAVDDALDGNVFMLNIPIKPSELIQQIKAGPRPSE